MNISNYTKIVGNSTSFVIMNHKSSIVLPDLEFVLQTTSNENIKLFDSVDL